MQEGAVHYSICKALHKAEMSLLVNRMSISYLAFPSCSLLLMTWEADGSTS